VTTPKKPRKKKRRSRADARDLQHFGTICTMVTLHVQLASMAPTPWHHHKQLEGLRDLIEQVEAGYETALAILEKELTGGCDICGAKLPEVGGCPCVVP